MAALATLLLLCSMIIAMPMVHGIDESPQAVEKWFEELGQMEEKVTKIHFYLHDTVSGNNITSFNVTTTKPNQFGQINVADDPFTTGPELNSTILGRAQGIYLGAGLQETDLFIAFNFVFMTGEYSGSTLSILGRDPILQKYREVPIVGGSGVFRLARGITTSQTYSFDTTSLNAVVEYQVIVIHY